MDISSVFLIIPWIGPPENTSWLLHPTSHKTIINLLVTWLSQFIRIYCFSSQIFEQIKSTLNLSPRIAYVTRDSIYMSFIFLRYYHSYLEQLSIILQQKSRKSNNQTTSWVMEQEKKRNKTKTYWLNYLHSYSVMPWILQIE